MRMKRSFRRTISGSSYSFSVVSLAKRFFLGVNLMMCWKFITKATTYELWLRMFYFTLCFLEAKRSNFRFGILQVQRFRNISWCYDCTDCFKKFALFLALFSRLNATKLKQSPNFIFFFCFSGCYWSKPSRPWNYGLGNCNFLLCTVNLYALYTCWNIPLCRT